MNITIFPTGKGGATSAVQYLLSDVDHEKKKRSVQPEILFGDPNIFTAIANSTTRLHKYTSGAISFRDHESISDEQITGLIETFRSTFMPGLKVDEDFVDFWVAHRDKGNLELHFLVANTLTDGSRLNIHPPGERNIQFFNSFVAVMNDNFGFAQVVPDPLKIALTPFEAKTPEGKRDKKAKADLAKALHTEIADGFIANRNQLIGYLKRHGFEVPKIGDDFITVRLPGSGRNSRLQGPLFSRDADYAALVEAHHQSKVPKFLTSDESEAQRAKLTAGIQARTAFNHRLYRTPKPGASRIRPTRKLPVAATRGSDSRSKSPATTQPAKEIRSTLNQQLESMRDKDAQPMSRPGGVPPQHARRLMLEPERASAATIVAGESAAGSLEAQIGSISMQYHNLLLMFVTAFGQRAQKIKSQMILLEQRLIALNLELEKKKAQLAEDMKLKYK